MCVYLSPIALLHELLKAPEDFLFVVRDVKEKEGNDVVHALDVADLIVIVGVCFKHVV